MDRGILVIAQNLSSVNYVQQAELLAMSLKATNPDTKISLVTNDEVEFENLFDKIIPIPWNDDAEGSDWKIQNRWKLYHASPYNKTIVMDTDMLVLQSISEWWNFLEKYKLFFTNKVYTYRGDTANTSYYRKVFEVNKLPNLYAGFHYFEKSQEAQEFYHWLELVMQNWQAFYEVFLEGVTRPKHISVDVCASIVSLILGNSSEITNNQVEFPSFTHMKKNCQGWADGSSNWQDRVGFYIARDCSIKIGNYSQSGILHYTEKDFLEKTPVIERYRNLLHV
tara:strand:+ start:561 stop:1400 length:840 start_codon:yes stop_codon:yes gene_type:complete